MIRAIGQGRLRLAVVVGLCAVLTAACSSVTRPTVEAGGAAFSEEFSATGDGTASAEGSGDTAGTVGGAGGPGGVGGPGAVGGSAGGTSGGIGGPGGAGGPRSTNACRTPVKLGLSSGRDQAAASGAVGGDPEQVQRFSTYQAAQKQLYQVAVDDVNRRGGIGGCPLTLVWHDFRWQSSEGWDAESQRECTAFAQDHKVFAVVPLQAETQTLVDCLSKHGIPVFHDASYNTDAFFPTKADFGTGFQFATGRIAVDRLGPAIDTLHAAGYFDPGARVGILIADVGRGVNQNLVNNLWRPRLEALGIPVVATFSYPQIYSFSDVGPRASDFTNAAVHFSTNRVSHVLVAPDAGSSIVLFTKAADSQKYWPRLGMTSYNGLNGAGDAPEASTVGATAVSWKIRDIAEQAKPPANPPVAARDRCAQLYRSAAAASGAKVEDLYPWCDVVNLLQAAFAGTTGPPTLEGLKKGVERLGTSFEIGGGFGPTRFGPRWYGGGVQVRSMKWNSQSKGWEYVSPPQAVP